MNEVARDLVTLPEAPVVRIARAATADAVRWSPEAKARLLEVAAQAVEAEARRLAKRATDAGRKTVQGEDISIPVRTSRRDATSRYIDWLEQANETFAQALRAAGVAIPTLPPCPGIPQE